SATGVAAPRSSAPPPGKTTPPERPRAACPDGHGSHLACCWASSPASDKQLPVGLTTSDRVRWTRVDCPAGTSNPMKRPNEQDGLAPHCRTDNAASFGQPTVGIHDCAAGCSFSY